MTPPPDSAPSSSRAASVSAQNEAEEAELRTKLRKSLKSLTSREPLDPTYKSLLFDRVVTPRQPQLPKDKLFKHMPANLRETVTNFTDHPWDKIAQREPLDEDKMRAAFTLREDKPHEQAALLKATLAARQPSNYASRKRQLEGMAMTLQNKKPKKKKILTPAEVKQKKEQEEEERRLKERQRQVKQEEQQKKREAARRRQLEEERREEEERIARMQETPQQKLARLAQPLFQKLWDMEFESLQNINPFRIVIDKDTCVAMGAPDYMQIISKPMNLTYIRDKLKNAEYNTLKEFFEDIQLMLSNALLYNSDPKNLYHIAAKQMKKVYKQEGQKLLAQLKTQGNL